MYLLGTLSSVSHSQVTENPINCASINPPAPGAWWVEYQNRNRWFDLTSTRVWTSMNGEFLTHTPNPAESNNENLWHRLMWHFPQGTYSCHIRQIPLGNGLIEVDHIHRAVNLGGSFNYHRNTEECDEVYEDDFDPFAEEPPPNCPIGGGGPGEEDDYQSEISSGGGWSFLCGEFDLAPGDYDIYVDGVYQETINCT
jgi:hypothetical protein